jgi:hypothetical protein
VLGTGAYVGGAFDQGEYYAIAPVDVETRLAGMNFGSELNGENGGTRVNVTFKFTEGEGMMGLEEDPLVNGIARIAMEEKVDSALDGRAFDKRRMQAKMAAMIAANPGKLAAMQKSLRDNIEKEMEEAEREFPAEYQSDEYGKPTTYGEPTSYGKPTMSTKPQDPADFEDSHADGGWGDN